MYYKCISNFGAVLFWSVFDFDFLFSPFPPHYHIVLAIWHLSLPNDNNFFPFTSLFCSRPTALQDRTRDSDEDDIHDRDYDVAALANNLSQAFRYSIYDNDDSEEVCRKWIILLNFFFFLSLSVCISVSFFLSGLIWFISCWSSWLQGHGALERDDEVILYSATFLINVLNSLHIMDENLKGDYTYI